MTEATLRQRAAVGTPAIEYEHVSVTFGGRGSQGTGAVPALADVTFAVPPGCFASVIGPSGCGKTTLLRLCAGLEVPSQGVTRCDGELVAGLNRAVGYVTQDSNLYPWMTVRENVEFPLEIRGLPRAERRERSDEHLRMVGLSGFEKHYPHQLSGGMQKRVSIVRTLIYEPQTVLMDEPFGALDSQTRMALQADLMRIWARQEQTILFITHDLTEAIALSDSILVMSQRPGTVKQIFDVPLARPRDVFGIQSDPAFGQVYQSVWEALRSDVLASVGEHANGVTPVSPATVAARPRSTVTQPAAEVDSASTASTLPAPAPSRLRRSVTWVLGNANLYRALILLAVLAAWEVAADAGVLNVLIFSHPLGVLDTLGQLLTGQSATNTNIYEQIRVTVSEMAIGFAIGGTIGIGLGFWLGRARMLARVLQPFILASYGVPIIAIAPILILVLGIGFPSKVGIATITAFFVIFFNTYAGVGAMSEEHLQLARIMGASRSRIVRRVMIPATLPFIFNGMRMAVPFSMTGAVIGEFVASSQGLGWYIVRATGAFDASGLFAGLIVMLVIVWALGQLVAGAERYFLQWQPPREAGTSTAPRT